MPGEDGFWSFAEVERRIGEAFATLAALPDRERGWLRTKTMAVFREVIHGTEAGDVLETSPVRLGVRIADYEAMTAALAWCEWLPAEGRRIVGLVMTGAGGAENPSWVHIRQRGRFDDLTTDTLRKRYSRAVTVIVSKLNCGKYAL